MPRSKTKSKDWVITQLQEKIHQLNEENIKLKKAGRLATELVAHLKDQHGFNTVEEAAQDHLNEVFGYDGPW